MAPPIKALAFFKDSNDVIEFSICCSQMTFGPPRYMRKSQVVAYFTAHIKIEFDPRSRLSILLARLPAAGVPARIAWLARACNHNAVLLEYIKTDPLWLDM
jgi:hypothetical protein